MQYDVEWVSSHKLTITGFYVTKQSKRVPNLQGLASRFRMLVILQSVSDRMGKDFSESSYHRYCNLLLRKHLSPLLYFVAS